MEMGDTDRRTSEKDAKMMSDVKLRVIHVSSVLIRYSLDLEELLDAPVPVEPAPATSLHSTMWKIRFVMDRHRVDMNSTIRS
jgi:hypothetical protein